MRVRKLDNNHDMCFGYSSKDFYSDQNELIAQNIYTRLMLWIGEWFLDDTEGTDWAGKCLGKHTEYQAALEIRSRILGTDGVNQIKDLSIEMDSINRKLHLIGNVVTIYGDLRLQFGDNYGNN